MKEKTHSKLQRIQWWQEARFGMFIHWGLFSVACNEKKWRGSTEVVMACHKIPAAEYAKLADKFNPVKFDAPKWVAVAKEAGMKYIVFTVKHAEGFSMYNSKVSNYNITCATPFGRDPLKELAYACQKENIKLCIYYSHVQDLYEINKDKEGFEIREKDEGEFQKYLDKKVKPQLTELLTGYGSIGIMWFDVPYHITKKQCADLANLVHKLQPDCLINSRIGFDNYDYFSAGDNRVLSISSTKDWETPATMNDSWCNKVDDHNWKSAEALIGLLVKINSRGGNYLLNVGPTGEGIFPEKSVAILKQVGKWMKINSESIYGTLAVPHTPFDFDFEITAKPGKVFLHFFSWTGKIRIPYFKSKVNRVYLLSDKSNSIEYKEEYIDSLDMHRLLLALPEKAPDGIDSVVVLEIDGEIEFDW